MRKRVLVAFISSILFSLGSALLSYTPESQRIPENYYPRIWDSFYLTFIYVTPVYLLIGIPISIGIDTLNSQQKKSKIMSYIINVGMYTISSLIPAFIIYMLLNGSVSFSFQGSFIILLLSVIASNLFYHVFFILDNLILKHYTR